MGIHKAPIKKSARIRKPIREERFVTGADVLGLLMPLNGWATVACAYRVSDEIPALARRWPTSASWV